MATVNAAMPGQLECLSDILEAQPAAHAVSTGRVGRRAIQPAAVRAPTTAQMISTPRQPPVRLTSSGVAARPSAPPTTSPLK